MLYLLVTYFDTSVPYYFVFQSVISFLRILQFIGPSFNAQESLIFPKGGVGSGTIAFFSILYQIIPPVVSPLGYYIMALTYIIFFVIFYVTYIASAFYYHNKVNLPYFLSITLSVLTKSADYLLHPVALNAVGVMIGLLISGECKNLYPQFITASVIAIIVFAISNWFHRKIFATTIMFRPDSLQAVDETIHIVQIYIPVILAFLGGLSSSLTLIPKVVVMVISLIAYIFSLYIIIKIAHPNRQHTRILMTCSLAGIINNLLCIVLVFINFPSELITIIIYIVIFIGCYYGCGLIQKRCIINDISILDDFDTNRELNINKANQLMRIIVHGYQIAHPCCLNYKVFDEANRLFPEDTKIIILYAKFVAIYPEINKTLSLIQQKLMATRKKVGLAKQIVFQIVSIIDTRENLLSPHLKKKIKQAQKKINSAKRKLLGIWDYVIQSNLSELDGAIEGAYQAANNAEREVLKIVSAYPNNVYVSRIYQRFLKEIKFDMKKNAEQIEKMRSLRRGQLVSMDRAKELGFHAFPNLPSTLDRITGIEKSTIDSYTNEAENVLEDDNQQNTEAVITLRQNIKKVTIPSVSQTIVFVLSATIILAFLPVILLVAFDSLYVDQISHPVSYINDLSTMRYMNFVVAANILRIGTEELVDDSGAAIGIPTNTDMFYPKGYTPKNIGDSREIRVQFANLVPQISQSTANINNLRSFKDGDESLRKIKDIVFEPSIPYNYFTDPQNYTVKNMSAVNCLMDVALQASRINQEKVVQETISTPQFLNPPKNCETVGNAISDVLEMLIDVVGSENKRIQNIFMIIEIAYCCFLGVVFISMIFFISSSTNREAREVYKALTLLPKAVVSQAMEAQRQIKKDSERSSSTGVSVEMNKQEENIIKVFAAASDSSSGYLPMHIVQSLAIIILLGVNIAAIVVMLELYKSQYQGLIESAPHADYLLGMCGYMYGMLVNLHMIALVRSGMTELAPTHDLQYVNVGRFDYRLSRFLTYFNQLRYGGKTDQEYPFAGFMEGLTIAAENLNCSADDRYVITQDFPEIMKCFNSEFQVMSFSSMARRLLDPFRLNMTFDSSVNKTVYDLTGKNYFLGCLWVLGPCIIYDTFVYHVHQNLISEITAGLSNSLGASMQGAIACMVVAAICVIIVIIEVIEIGKRIRFTMSLFLQVDTHVVNTTPKIVQLIGGNFSSLSAETSTRNSEFFEEVVDNLINSVIICSPDGIILTMNRETKTAFKVDLDEFKGKHYSKFFTTDRFGSSIDPESLTKNPTTQLHSGNEFYECRSIITKESIFFSLSNMTTRVVHAKLITEERAKSDAMLQTILPPKMVARVQAGESNISFAVQTASVLFLDIVSFTPWCGANQASYIMKVLNRLFKDLDAKLKEFPTMTKIKCIGDCYMAAGGIFSEVNLPAQHAREVVAFGLEAIKAVEEIDKELNEKLQIRVGVNTGGPLVAGVIGTGKPTFEIIGPCINMAQQMEHHGVPMKVHISRTTYELIYGMNFNIKERGEVEVKQGKVTTYVVSPN